MKTKYFNDAIIGNKNLKAGNNTIKIVVTAEDGTKKTYKINVEKEGNVENLLKAKGFKDAIVYITDDSVSVTVKTDGLTAADSAKIYDIVISETGVSSDKIKIIEIK